MPRLLPTAVEAMRLSQQYFDLPDILIAALNGCVPRTVSDNRNKGRWLIGEKLPSDDARRRATLTGNAAGLWTVEIAPAQTQADAAQEPKQFYTDAEMEAMIDEQWRGLQGRLLAVLNAGSLGTIERKAFERLEFDMRYHEKLLKQRAAIAVNVSRAAAPDDAEVADVLRKMEKRINELAELRFQELIEGQIQRPEFSDGGAGMDVHEPGQADPL